MNKQIIESQLSEAVAKRESLRSEEKALTAIICGLRLQLKGILYEEKEPQRAALLDEKLFKQMVREAKKIEREARYKKAWDMRQAGVKFKDIGKAFGVSPARATDLVRAHEWIERRKLWQAEREQIDDDTEEA